MSLRIDYIGATWCKVCVIVKPEIEKLAKDFSVELKIYDADTMGDDMPDKVPSVRLFKNDVLVKEIITKHTATLNELLVAEKGVVLNADF